MQIPLDIPIREAFNVEDYLVTESNREAVQWIDRWPDWTETHCCILYGEAGCGKTHLSHVWQGKAKAVRGTLEQIDEENLTELISCLIIEDVDQVISDLLLQKRLFHIYNWQKQNGGFLLLTAKAHPKFWQLDLPDIQSRMLASMAIEIGLPDDMLLTAVIMKQFTDRQIKVPMEVINFITVRLERSFEAARKIVNQIDNLSLSEKRKITIPLIRELLE